jgi:hypothetical protein
MACPSCNKPRVIRMPSMPQRVPNGERLNPKPQLPPQMPQGNVNREKITGLRYVPK